jgi:uncharacterized protein (UPF0216 family)
LERSFDALLGHELRKLNTHLPKKRYPLSELLVKDAIIETIDGSSIMLRQSELEDLSAIVPPEYHDRLKIPIVVLRRMELGKSVYTVSGGRLEEFTVKKILGKTRLGYREMYTDNDPLYLYRPDVSELLRRFHSLVVIAFGLPRELSDYAPNRV